MKYTIVILFALVALTYADEFRMRNKDDLIKAIKECAAANKVPLALAKKYKKSGFPDTEMTRCYIQCILQKLELFGDTTGFNKPHLIYQLSHDHQITDNLRMDVDACVDKNEKKAESCGWAFHAFNCLKSKNLTFGFECHSNNH